jgi:hypothetical protein
MSERQPCTRSRYRLNSTLKPNPFLVRMTGPMVASEARYPPTPARLGLLELSEMEEGGQVRAKPRKTPPVALVRTDVVAHVQRDGGGPDLLKSPSSRARSAARP